MPGFACVIADQVETQTPALKHEPLVPLVFRENAADGFYAYMRTTAKFPHDQVFAEDDDVFIIIHGVVLNFKSLQVRHACTDYFNTAKAMYQADGDEFFQAFRGDFSGLLHDKAEEKWLIFTNHTGSKPVFYFQDERFLVCASELEAVTQILAKLGCRYSLDQLGACFLLTFGFMLEDYTLIREVKKLKAGSYLKITPDDSQVNVYELLDNTPSANRSREQIIDELEILFKTAVAQEYEKDLEYGYRHLATLSGGLDSRMATVTACELGYENIVNVTFSQSNHWDELVPKALAADLGNEFLFYALDNGNYLTWTIENAVSASGGLALYAGAAHSLAMYRNLRLEPFGVLHSGQIGDAVLGSFLSKPSQEKPQPFAGAYSTYLGDAISAEIAEIQKNYDTNEIFLFYNRAFNGAFNGNWVANQFTEMCSPFLDLEFLKYCLRIPPGLRFKEQIYRDWILAKRPRAARYPWAKTGERLTTPDALVKVKHLMRKVRRKLFGARPSENMNPFQHWWRTNPRLRQYVDDYFRGNLDLLDGYPELKGHCQTVFDSDNLLARTQVMTLLEAIKLHFR